MLLEIARRYTPALSSNHGGPYVSSQNPIMVQLSAQHSMKQAAGIEWTSPIRERHLLEILGGHFQSISSVKVLENLL